MNSETIKTAYYLGYVCTHEKILKQVFTTGKLWSEIMTGIIEHGADFLASYLPATEETTKLINNLKVKVIKGMWTLSVGEERRHSKQLVTRYLALEKVLAKYGHTLADVIERTLSSTSAGFTAELNSLTIEPNLCEAFSWGAQQEGHHYWEKIRSEYETQYKLLKEKPE